MNSTIARPSLYPYLESGGERFCLKLSMDSLANLSKEKALFPFSIIDNSQSLARTIKAQFITDAGSKIKEVFVLLQHDEYLFSKDGLWPFSNQQIDECWQRAFSLYSDKAQEHDLVTLSDQINEKGQLVPFQPLFFCNKKEAFFHPQCPTCGAFLYQCYDDNLLNSLGLQPYSSSLKRYLFCTTCMELVGQSDFYVSELDGTDPDTVKDRWDLVREFGGLSDQKDPSGDFPCLGCPDYQQCYGPEGPAASRIVPVCFYPFYMFIFGAMSVNAPDFLALVSGASFLELESRVSQKKDFGRISHARELLAPVSPVSFGPCFLFDNDERYFLEVLYLKLSFLGDLFRDLSCWLDVFKSPDLGLSLDRVWVRFADQSGLLPFMWNFKVRLIDIGGGIIDNSTIPKLPPTYGLHFMGLVWFYALLVNGKQDVSIVYKALSQALEGKSSISSENGDNDDTKECSLDGAFLAENIFWNPEQWQGTSFPEDWMRLWKSSIDMGWSFLIASMKGETWSNDEFWSKWHALRKEVKDCLFGQLIAGEDNVKVAKVITEITSDEKESEVDSEVDNEAISQILLNISAKWRKGFEVEKDVKATGRDEVNKKDEDELEKTVAISAETIRWQDQGEEEALVDDEDEFHETVILSSADFKDDLKDNTPMTPTGGEESMDETVVLSGLGSTKTSDVPAAVSDEQDDALDETVIIRPNRSNGKD